MYGDEQHDDQPGQVDALMRAGQYTAALELLHAWYAREPWNSGVLMRMAVVHWLAGEPAHTLHDLDALLLLEPDNAEALARRAQALLMLGKHEDAEATLRKAEQLDPMTPGVLLNKALVHESHEAYADAIACLTAYLEQIPQDFLARARRSHLYRHVGLYPQALDDACACVAEQPEDAECHFAEALARITMEQGDEALAACDRAIACQPAFLPALRLRVDLLADLGRLDEAESTLQTLATQGGEAAQHAVLQARIAAEQGRYDEALRWIDRYLDDFPDEPYGFYRRGMIHYRMGQFAAALEDFRAQARLAPQALEALEQQFLCYLELGKIPEAVEVARRAVDLQPENYRVQYNLAYAELLSGHQDDALAGFHAALALRPLDDEVPLRIHLALSEYATPEVRLTWFSDAAATCGQAAPMVLGLLAECYLEAGDQARALEIAREVRRLDPQRIFGYMLGIKALSLLDRFEEALVLADAGVARLPDEGRLRLVRAQLLRDTGKPDEALRELQQARPYLDDDAMILQQEGLIYGAMGQVTEAIRLLEEAMHLEGDNLETLFWLGYFYIHRKRYRQALAVANNLLAAHAASAEGRMIRGVALHGLRHHREAQEVLRQVQEEAPQLYARLSTDPVIAALITRQSASPLSSRMRRIALDYWQSLCHLLGA